MKTVAHTVQELMAHSQKFSADVGRVLNEQEVADSRISSGSPRLRRLSDARGISFFSCGPVYTQLGVSFDILAEFAQVSGLVFDALTLDTEIELLAGIPGPWARLLQGVPDQVFTEFTAFMTTQGARLGGDFWQFSAVGVTGPDPLAIRHSTLKTVEPDARFTVFLPSGSRYRLVVQAVNTKWPAPIYRQPADPAVVRLAAAGGNLRLSDAEYQQFQRTGRLPFRV